MKKIFIACSILLIAGLTALYFCFDYIQNETNKTTEQEIQAKAKEKIAFKKQNEQLIYEIYEKVPLEDYGEKMDRLSEKMTSELITELFEVESPFFDDVYKVMEVKTEEIKDLSETHRQTTTFSKIMTVGGSEVEVTVVSNYQKVDGKWLMENSTPVESAKASKTKT